MQQQRNAEREKERESGNHSHEKHTERENEKEMVTNSSKKGLMKEREETCFGRNYLRSNLKTLNQFVFEFRTVYKLEHGGVNKKKIKQKYLLKGSKSTEERIFFV